jgi:hypothetical protein
MVFDWQYVPYQSSKMKDKIDARSYSFGRRERYVSGRRNTL